MKHILKLENQGKYIVISHCGFISYGGRFEAKRFDNWEVAFNEADAIMKLRKISLEIEEVTA
jgi:hypothetical protein